MPRSTPTQAKAAARRTLVSRGPMAHAIRDAAMADKVQHILDSGVDAVEAACAAAAAQLGSLTHAQGRTAVATAAIESGLTLADVATACRNAAAHTPDSADAAVRARQHQLRAALDAPIRSWDDLDAALANTRTMLEMRGQTRLQLRVVCDALAPGGTLISALDRAPESAARANRVHMTYFATRNDLDRMIDTYLGPFGKERGPLYCMTPAHFRICAARIAAARSAEAARVAPETTK